MFFWCIGIISVFSGIHMYCFGIARPISGRFHDPPVGCCKYFDLFTTPNIFTMDRYKQGAEETVSHCIVNKQMASASSYIIFPLLDCDWSIKMPSIIWFGSTSVGIVAAYVNNWHR